MGGFERTEFKAGEHILYETGPQAFRMFTVARWIVIPLSLLGAVVCYVWGSALYSRKAGMMAAVLWCFSPNILANAAMFTPDCGAAAFGVLACYLFWLWLRKPNAARTFFAGIGLGLAELTKFTWIILFPLWVFLWTAYRWRRASAPAWTRQALQLTLIFVLAVFIINAGYGYEGSLTPLKDLKFLSKKLAGKYGERQDITDNRFRHAFLADMLVPLPYNYVTGIDRQMVDFELGFRSYLAGQWKFGGWWYYYLYALLVKVPVGTWLLLMLAIGVSIRSARRRRSAAPDGQRGCSNSDVPTWRDELCLVAPAVVVLGLVSSQTGFNHHLRYVLPAFPFAFIFIGKVATYCRWPPTRRTAACCGSDDGSTPATHGPLTTLLAAAALLWSIGSSLWVFPHSLSYFNELAGGPMNGHRHLVDSNIDWGQDLLYLKQWYDSHPEARPFHLAYFGLVDPQIAGIECDLPPADPRPGWHAVSVNFVRGLVFGVRSGPDHGEWADEDRFTYFQHFEPTAHAGYSIYIYHITDEQAQRVRQELGYPPLPERR